MPAIRATDLAARTGSLYPEPFRSRVLPREKRALGDAFGLTGFGVNLTVLHPGAESSMRHWHSHEDELIYPDVDMAAHQDAAGKWIFLRKDGSAY